MKFANEARRTLGLAYRDFSSDEWANLKEQNNNFETEDNKRVVEEELIMLCIFGIIDPVRPGVTESIRHC